jgi:hypothetical protein
MTLRQRVAESVARFFPFGVITAAVLCFFWQVLFLDRDFFIGDIYSQFYPWKVFLKESIKNGITPFWNPFVYSGVPFMADVQKGAFYPPGIIFFFFDFSAAFKIFIAGHFILAGFSLYLLMREFGFSRLPALAGALIFLFNTFTVSRVNFLSALGAYCLLPSVLFFFHRLISRRLPRDFAWFLLTFSALCLSGHPPTAIYTAIFLLSFFIYVKFFSQGFAFRPASIGRYLFWGAASVIIIALLTLPQAAIFFEFLARSTRGGAIDYAVSTSDSMLYSGLWAFLFPGGTAGLEINALADWNVYAMGLKNFFSVTFIFLLAVSFFYPKNGLVYFSYVMAAVSLFVSLGSNTPVHSWFFAAFPFFSTMRHPGFAMTLFTIPAAVITAFTFERLLSPPLKKEPSEGPFLLAKLSEYMNMGFTAGLTRIFIVALFFLFLILINYAGVIRAYNFTAPRFIGFVFGYFFFLALFGANIALYVFKERGKISVPFYAGVVLFACFFELFTFASVVNPSVEGSIYSLKNLNLKTPAVISTSSYKFIHTQEAQKSRVYSGAGLFAAQKNYLESIPSNTGMLFGLHDAWGYNPIESTAYAATLEAVTKGNEIKDYELLNLLNARYVFAARDLENPGHLQKIYDDRVKIYSNQHALPIFFVSGSVEKPEMIIAQTSYTRKNEFDFSDYRITLNSSDAGYFIFCNNHYPGWKAYLNNKSARIEPAFGIYMGVKVEQGFSEIIFRYKPVGFPYFLALSYIAFIMMAAAALWPFFRGIPRL